MASDIDWPADLGAGLVLPAPLRDGYGYAPRSAVAVTEFGVVTVVRRIYSDTPAEFSQIGWVFTADQWALFEGFFWHALDAGTRYFNLPLLVAGRAVAPVECSFLGRMPRFGLVGAQHCNTVGQITTRSGTAMSAALYAALTE